jgi:hypothetical protein
VQTKVLVGVLCFDITGAWRNLDEIIGRSPPHWRDAVFMLPGCEVLPRYRPLHDRLVIASRNTETDKYRQKTGR